MKRVNLPLHGKEYPMCFSLRVVNACGERFGGLEGLDAALTGGGDALSALNNCVWLLAEMLDAGHKFSALSGVETEHPPTEADLLDLFGLDDLSVLRELLAESMRADRARTVEAAPGKNGDGGEAEATSP